MTKKTAPLTFDIGKLDVEGQASEGAVMTLRHPSTDEDLPITIRLMGEDSKIARDQSRKAVQKGMNRGSKKIKAADLEKDAVARIAALTLSWTGLIYNGEELVCTENNKLTIYSEQPWVRAQAIQFIEDRANFIS